MVGRICAGSFLGKPGQGVSPSDDPITRSSNHPMLLEWFFMSISPARAAAFEILMRVETTDAYASELLHASRFEKLSPADHGLLTELVMGTLRWRGVLDSKIADCYARSSADQATSRTPAALVANNPTSTPPQNAKSGLSGDPGPEHPSTLSNQSLARLDGEVLTALRLGAYQILFLDRVPRHAAVSESVDLVKSAHKRSAAGLVNAVLRKIGAAKDEGRSALDESSAHPRWLVDRWTGLYGADATGKICAHGQVTPRPVVRVNDEAVLAELGDEGIQVEPGKLLSAAFIVKSGNITRTKAFRERRVTIQDEASQLVALLVGRGMKILDCCAAPGGKTRILAERNPEAIVLAMDLHLQRAALLRKLVPAGNVRMIVADARKAPFAGSFDRILVDAPCSGTGTLARNPEIKWRLRAEDLLRLQRYQVEILRAAMKLVSPGGRIVYSTCSLEREENEEVINKSLAGDGSFHVVNCGDELEKLANGEFVWAGDSLVSERYLRTVPGVHPCAGFFAAVIARE
jgi:16S rRNA (cytosine967-C5)-methyltransferase